MEDIKVAFRIVILGTRNRQLIVTRWQSDRIGIRRKIRLRDGRPQRALPASMARRASNSRVAIAIAGNGIIDVIRTIDGEARGCGSSDGRQDKAYGENSHRQALPPRGSF